MRQKKERKNGGFTLVEILVAITILGIIVVPFMHSFVTASRTNAKAKKLQNATALGANLMEEIKANSMEELAFQFNYPTRYDDDGNPAGSRFEIVDASSYQSVGEVRWNGTKYENVLKYQKNANGQDNRANVTASVLYEEYDPGSSEKYEYLGQDSGKYYFVMRGATSGTGIYDALITMDANTYKTVDSQGYNDQTTPVIDSVDVRQDAFYVQESEDLELYKKVSGETEDQTALVDGDLTNDELKRTIVLDIEKVNERVNVYVTYQYEIYDHTTHRCNPVVEDDKLGKTLIYTNEESPGYSLRNIYLFYLPNYACNSVGSPVKDQIVINNPNNVEADLYLVKQKQSSFNTYLYEMKETTYYCEVSIMEDVGSFYTGTHKGALKIRTNLNENIYNEKTNLINKYKLVYGNKGGTQNAYDTDAKRILDEKPLDGSKVKDRVYDVTIEIYEAGQAEEQFSDSPIAVLTGSKDH